MSRKKASEYMAVWGYSVTYGLLNDARVGESGFLKMMALDWNGQEAIPE